MHALTLHRSRHFPGRGHQNGQPRHVRFSAPAVDVFTRAQKFKLPCPHLDIPGQKLKKLMSHMPLLKAARDMEIGVTVNDFR